MKRQDLPLDLVVLADLGLEAGHAALGRIHRIEPENFAAFMSDARPTVTIGSGASATKLAFDDPRAFRPEGLSTQVPELAALMGIRQKVSQRGLEKREVEELIAGLPAGSALRLALEAAAGGAAKSTAAAPPSPPPAASPAAPPPRMTPASTGTGAADSIDALFDMVDVAATPAPAEEVEPRATTAGTRALDKLVALLGASGSGQQAGSSTQAALARAIDDQLSETLRAILSDPAFQALEQAWTGLRFLVRRVDFRSGVRLHVLPTTRAQVAKHASVLLTAFAEDQRREARVTVAMADFDLAGDAAGFELAAALAAAGAATQTPILAGLDAALLGIPSLAKIEYVENIDALLADDAHAGWHALRATEDSRWLALIANRFLMRLPYGAEMDKVKGFAFEENPDDREPSYLWGRGTWAIGERIAASYVRCGWGTELTGQDEETALGDLPVRLTRLRTGEIVPAPLEAMLSERRALEFAEGGITALLCRRGGDTAFLAGAPMVHRPPNAAQLRGAEGRRDTLPFALMVAQVGAWIAHLESQGRFASDEERRDALARGIQFLSMNEDGPTLEARAEAQAVRVTPWRDPLRGLPDFLIALDRTH